MKIYVVGSSKNKFLPLDDIREKFLIDQPHEGDNIDFLNPWYCELTGLYYLWKHVDDDIVGLEHYRRYFVNEKGELLGENKIREILKDNDVICRKWVFKEHNQKNTYQLWNTPNHKHIVKFFSLLPKNEKNFFEKKFNESTHFAQCNMFICKKEIISKYMNWFFDYVINWTSKELKSSPRIIGYISEFIFGYWLELNNYKIHWNKSITYNQKLSKVI